MTSRALLFLAFTVAAGACSKNSQETDALSPPPRDTARTTTSQSKKPAADTTQVRMERPDTSQYGKDSVRHDTTGTSR
jgi:hypothetical protein